MRSPGAEVALEIHVLPLGLLPVTHVAPPSRDTCILPPASPATITSPVPFIDIECQMRGVASASAHVYEGAADAAVASSGAVADCGASAANIPSPPPPHA